jgi:hypothetical protein
MVFKFTRIQVDAYKNIRPQLKDLSRDLKGVAGTCPVV